MNIKIMLSAILIGCCTTPMLASASGSTTIDTRVTENTSAAHSVIEGNDYAPESLAGMKLIYKISKTIDNGLPAEPGNYPARGEFIDTFTESHLVSDGFNAYFFDYDSPYELTHISENSVSYSVFGGYIVNTLTFTGPSKGTFVSSVLGGLAEIHGDFKYKNSATYGLAPKNLKDLGFVMTVEEAQGEIGGSDLPSIGSSLTYRYAKHTKAFVQSDLYDKWDYVADYFYQRDNDNTATVNSYLRQSGRNISFEYSFNSISGGSFSAKVGGGSSFKGTFFYSLIEPAQDYPYANDSIADKAIFKSTLTAVEYPYRVYLPRGYSESNKNYPVIYATDGQWVFWDFARAIDKRDLDVILVAIEQGPNNRRETDYILPGSELYLQFFKEEFIPAIESLYRIDSDNRTFQGASYGGSVARHAFIDSIATKTFKNFIAADGSYWHEPAAYLALEDSAFANVDVVDARLFLTGGQSGGNDFVVQEYCQSLLNRSVTGLEINCDSYHLRHVQMAQPSFESALDALY